MQLKAGSSVLLALIGAIFTPLAQAHMVAAETMGLASGLLHPLTGPDHVLAAVAAGIWAAVLGGSHTRSVVGAFLGMLGLGAIAGFAGISLAMVEPVIALSVIAMGALIVLRMSVPRVVASAIAGGFAMFHGYAHVAGVPLMASAVWYMLGLLMATSLLLSFGTVLGHWLAKSESLAPVSLAGGLIASIGSMLLVTA